MESRESREFLKAVANESGVPVDCTLDLTTRCNFSCVHCYLGDSPRTDMDVATARTRLQDLLEAGTVWLTITGGEPTLHPHFEELYLLAATLGFVPSVFSNGSLLESGALDVLTHHPPRLLQVSMYGATVESFESVTRVGGSWESFLGGLTAAADSGLSLGIKWVALRQNVHELERGAALAADFGAAFAVEALITPVLGSSVEPTETRLSANEIVRLHTEGWDVLPAATPGAHRVCAFDCSAGKSLLHLSVDGSAHPCAMCQQPSTTGGALFGEEWRRVRLRSERPLAHSKCQQCDEYEHCPVCPGWEALSGAQPGEGVEWLCGLSYTWAEARREEAYAWQTPNEPKHQRTTVDANGPPSKRSVRSAATDASATVFAGSSRTVSELKGHARRPTEQVELARPVVLRRVAGECVAVMPGRMVESVLQTPEVVVLNELGFEVLEVLARRPMSATEIASTVRPQLPVADTLDFLDELSELGIVRPPRF